MRSSNSHLSPPPPDSQGQAPQFATLQWRNGESTIDRRAPTRSGATGAMRAARLAAEARRSGWSGVLDPGDPPHHCPHSASRPRIRPINSPFTLIGGLALLIAVRHRAAALPLRQHRWQLDLTHGRAVHRNLRRNSHGVGGGGPRRHTGATRGRRSSGCSYFVGGLGWMTMAGSSTSSWGSALPCRSAWHSARAWSTPASAGSCEPYATSW